MHPVGLDVWVLVGPFVYFHTSCMRTAKALARLRRCAGEALARLRRCAGEALARLRRCAGSPEPSLVAYVISSIMSWAGSFIPVWTVVRLSPCWLSSDSVIFIWAPRSTSNICNWNISHQAELISRPQYMYLYKNLEGKNDWLCDFIRNRWNETKEKPLSCYKRFSLN